MNLKNRDQASGKSSRTEPHFDFNLYKTETSQKQIESSCFGHF